VSKINKKIEVYKCVYKDLHN